MNIFTIHSSGVLGFWGFGVREKVLCEILDQNFIQEPNRHFKISLDFESKQNCEKFLQSCFSTIEKCLIGKKNELSVYKIQQVVQLSNLIKCDSVQKRLVESWDTVVANLSKEIDQMCLNIYILKRLRGGYNH